MIGKRAKPEAASEDNPVESVDFISVEDLQPKKAKKVREGDSVRNEDPEALPKSIKERFGNPKHQRIVEKKPIQEETKQTETKPSKDWSAIYGEASKQISSLIDRQSQMLQGKADAQKGNQNKKNKFGDKNNKGGERKEPKKPKYYLGSSIAGERKFNAL